MALEDLRAISPDPIVVGVGSGLDEDDGGGGRGGWR
jgi:hypothetical protein